MLPAVCDWGDDGRADQSDDDEDAACDSGFGFGEGIGGKNLVEE